MSTLDSAGSADAGDTDMRKLVILGLPWDTTEASLEQYFSQIGPLQVCHRPCGWSQHRHSIVPSKKHPTLGCLAEHMLQLCPTRPFSSIACLSYTALLHVELHTKS